MTCTLDETNLARYHHAVILWHSPGETLSLTGTAYDGNFGSLVARLRHI